MKIDYLHALKRIEQCQGVWLLHGDEPLLQQNLLDGLRQYWQQHDIERQRFDLTSISDWKLVFNALDSLSLFSTQLAVEVHGNIKPDKNIQQQLTYFLQHNQDNSLIIILPKQESSFFKTTFYQSIEANGVVVPLQANSLHDQQHILQLEADKLGIHLDNSAWQWLLQHHEHNLLSARNSLIRVHDTFADLKQITVEQLLSCLHDQSRYTVYDLGEQILQGHFANCVKIFNYLIEADEPMSLILWVISKETHLLMQLYEQPQNALQLGIWKNKVSLYQQAVRRLNPQLLLQFPSLLLRIDQAIKGLSKENPQHLCLQILALLCGQQLFN
ncbi:DNA polymerase III subunit delta [Moraxella sp. ZY210820]|uniref:DNA polymerase III subunit delta n=1 Tax=unclassified Moraxella TaxID=2685852 RepID=UPI00272F0832|nr:DNA polymerase III subunit delta [Moraxella sp. ZY210820]WLF83417.1 DNA polymerase III subunit delta [Moraxella sp. ZY210820]